MVHSTCLLFILFFTIIRSIDGALSIHDQNLHPNNFFSQFEKIPSIINVARDAVERFQCPKDWERFGGSCYFLPNTKSMPSIASQTCIRYSNNSQLMKIRHSPELFYAAYVLKIHNQQELMIEIDSKLLKKKKILNVLSTKDWFKWQQENEKFRQASDAYFNRKMKASDDKPVHTTMGLHSILPFTLTSTDASTMVTGKMKNYNKDFERIDDLYHACDQFVWNTFQTDSHILALTTYLMSNRTVCSLSGIEPDESYPYMCQYVLDYCFANDECGKFGRCINTLTGSKCSCYFVSQGSDCRSLSGPFKQMIIVLGIIIIIKLCIWRESLKSLWSRIKWILTCCKTEQETLDNEQNDDSVAHDDSDKRSFFGWCLFGILGILILILLLIIPTVYRPTLLRFKPTDQLNTSLLIGNFKQMTDQCKRNPFIQGIIIVCGLLAFIIGSPFLLMKQRKESGGFFKALTEFLIPFKPFDITNRYETASIFGIAVFEVLTTFNYVLFDLNESLGRGVLTQVAQSFLNLFLVVIKYYPILISLRQKNVIIRFIAVLYFMVNIIFIINDKKSCLDLFPRSEKISDIEEAKFYVIHGKWIIGYGLFRNILYFILLAFIGAEVIVRLFDALTREQSKTSDTHSNKTSNNVKRKFCCSCLRSIFNYIYPWNDKFRFITISFCTYITALIFIHYLTCTLTIHSLIGRSSYITFLIDVVKSILHIEIPDMSLRYEIIFSGVITMIFFSYQLFTGMKNCKKNAKKPCQNTNKNDSSTNSITSESIGYLKLSIPCMALGVYILFPLVLFISIIAGRIPTQFASVEPLLSFILPLFLLYELQTSIMELIHTFSPKQQSENKRTVTNDTINTFYVIFITSIFIGNFHIGIAACALRLFKIILDYIISGTQIDCSYLGQPSEMLEYPRIEHLTIDDKTSNSQNDHEVEENDTSLASAMQPSDSTHSSSIGDSHDSSELIINCTSQEQVPLSPGVKPPQASPIQQQKRSTEPAHVTILIEGSSTVKSKHSHHHHREKKIDDDLNSQQQRTLLLQDSRIQLENDSEEIRRLFRRTTAV